MAENRLNNTILVFLLIIIAVLSIALMLRWNTARDDALSGTGRQTGGETGNVTGESPKWNRLTLKELEDLAATVKGIVTRADNGSAIRGTAVTWSVDYQRDIPSKGTTRSRLDGSYELKPLLRESVEDIRLTASSGQWLTVHKDIEIRIGDTMENVNFAMTDVTDITVTVLDVEDNSPVTGVKVAVWHPQGQTQPMLLTEQEPGEYLGQNVKKGYYNIKLFAEGFAELQWGIKVEKVNQKFEILIGRCAMLAGRVSDPGGNPIENAIVYFRMAGGMTAKTMTDEKGDYLFDRLKPCQGEVAAEHPDYAKRVDAVLYRFENVAPSNYYFLVNARGHITITEQGFTITPDAGELLKNFSMDPGSRIFGRVVDSDGEPVAGVTVRAEPPRRGFPTSTKSDENGDFEIGGLLPDQAYKVEFIPPNHGYLRMDNIPADKDLGAITLESYGSLRGKVMWEETPLRDVEILVWKKEADSTRWRKVTDSNGEFFFKQLRPGIYHFEANADGFQKHVVEAVITGNTTAPDMMIGLIRLRPR
ncbi:MAG: carboxypeptidase regulatory-like domain-containing protein [Planctomycetota bacterium]|jgi:protocatechuate 3,4-dioxygenase beta subunit